MNANQTRLGLLSANQAFEFYGIRYHVVATEDKKNKDHYIVYNHKSGLKETMHIEHAVTKLD